MDMQPATAEAFWVETDLDDGFHYVIDATGERASVGYPLKKTANRRARQLIDAASILLAVSDLASPNGTTDAERQEIEDEAELAAMPTRDELAPKPTLFEMAEAARLQAEQEAAERAAAEPAQPVQIDVENIAPTVQPGASKPRFLTQEAIANIVTREDWLGAASILISQVLADQAEIELPAYRVTCGWPSRGATGKKQVIGQCWNPDASADAHAEVFISPVKADPREVVAILAHELIHAGLPAGTGHKGPFVKAAKAIGFVAPFTQLTTSDAMDEWADRIVAALPAYPHAVLNPMDAEGAPKPQKNRQLLARCEEDHEGETCGYQVRLTRKWIDTLGAPLCPRHMVAMVCEGVGEEPEGEDDGEGEEG